MAIIMVVEDNDDIREMTSEFLQGHGYQVLEATNGREALQLLDGIDAKPCLLLLDLMMPVMGGVEFLHELEASGRLRSYPVIVISAGHVQRSDVPQATELMRKPPNYTRLIEMVKEICPPDCQHG